MKVLITTQVYPPELHPTGQLVLELAAYLSAKGHEVTVAAGFPHHPKGKLIGGYRRRLLQRESQGGVTIVRGFHTLPGSMAIPARAASMLTQAVGTALAGAVSSSPDVIVSFGPPLVGPLSSALLAKSKNASLVTVIYDIYPDVAIDAGVLSNRVLVAAARLAERTMYGSASQVVVLSPRFKQSLLSRGVPAEKISIVPVWLKDSEIVPSPRLNDWRREQGYSNDDIVVLIAGTVGRVSGAEVILDAAEMLRDLPYVRFLFVGEGHLKPELQRVAAERQLTSVAFLPFQPREKLPEVQAAADIALVTLAPGRAQTSVPSKVVSYMAAGRPIVASVDEESDTANAVRSAGGIVVAPANPRALSSALRALSLDSARRQQIGTQARAAFEGSFAASTVLPLFESVLQGAVA